ncbi:CinA family protein [Nocardioides terrisoli]|uniref:CinA family protein n=1 Tax=Nocardioides terrisoli TaxID=3388267 RepID=UPI00287B975E|nr:CinA family protein [Nocardioides marmorisolisilvae]
MEQIAAALHTALRGRGETVACAESLTGGELAALLTAAPGASQTFVGGVVSYATAVKRDLLGVRTERVITGECAEQMAAGVRALLGTDWALATTGVAGPERQEGEPVGTVYVGIAGPDGARSVRLDLDGDRTSIRARTCRSAIEELIGDLG